MELIIGWLLLSGLVAALAASRGRNFLGYFLLAIVTSPLLGLIIVLVIADLKKKEASEAEARYEQLQREAERKREHERELEAIRALSASQPPRSPIDGSPTVADQLEKLGELLNRGLLTAEEFAQQKTKLLGKQ